MPEDHPTTSTNSPLERDAGISPRAWALGVGVVMAAAFAIQAVSLNRPFIDQHDWATAHQAQFARNHLRYGLADTLTRCVYSRQIACTPQARRTYPDHPPLLSLVLALCMFLFGENEVAVRLVPSLCTTAAVGLTMSIAGGLYGRRIGLLAGLALLPLPIVFYFGHVANHEPLTLAFALLALRGYLGWVRPEALGEHPRRNAGLFAGGIVLAILSGWAGLLFAGVIGMHFVVAGRRSVRGPQWRAWCLTVLSILGGAAVTFTHVLWSMDWQWHRLVGLFAFRSGLKPGEPNYWKSTGLGWLAQQGEWLWRDYTAAGLALAAVGLFFWLRRRSRPDQPERLGRASEAWLLAAPGLLFVLIFRSGSYLHEYWWWHLTPFVAILIACALGALGRRARVGVRPIVTFATLIVLALMATETLLRRNYYRHPTNPIPRTSYEACRYIAAHTPPDAVVSGNADLWVRREYYEGPMEFLNPQIAWYLDRSYVAEDRLRYIAYHADHTPYYLFIPRARRDEKLRQFMLQNYRVRERWSKSIVFDLTSPPDSDPPK